MNYRRLLPLTAVCAFTFGAVVDPHTTERITPTAAAVTTIDTPEPFPTLFIPGDCDSYRFIASQVWPEIDTPGWPTWSWVVRTMDRESDCLPDPPGVNDTNQCGRQSHGILQIQFRLRVRNGVCVDIYWNVPMRTGFGPLNVECGITSKDELLNPAVNLRCARVLFMAFGYQPWRVR